VAILLKSSNEGVIIFDPPKRISPAFAEAASRRQGFRIADRGFRIPNQKPKNRKSRCNYPKKKKAMDNLSIAFLKSICLFGGRNKKGHGSLEAAHGLRLQFKSL